MNMQRPRLIGTITDKDGMFGIATGCAFYPINGNSGVANDFVETFGEAKPHDIGKRGYNHNGVIVMENDEQRDARNV